MERREFSCNYCIFSGDFETIVHHSIRNHANKLLNVRQRVVSSEDGTVKTRILRYGLIPENIPQIGKNIQLDAKKLLVFVDSSRNNIMDQETFIDQSGDHQSVSKEKHICEKTVGVSYSITKADITEQVIDMSASVLDQEINASGSAEKMDLISGSTVECFVESSNNGRESVCHSEEVVVMDTEDKENDTSKEKEKYLNNKASSKLLFEEDTNIRSTDIDILESHHGPIRETKSGKNNISSTIDEVISGSEREVSPVASDISGKSDYQDPLVMENTEEEAMEILYSRSNQSNENSEATGVTMETEQTDSKPGLKIKVWNEKSDSDSYETAEEETCDLELDYFLVAATHLLDTHKFAAARQMTLNAYKKLEALERDPLKRSFPFANYYLKCMHVFLQEIFSLTKDCDTEARSIFRDFLDIFQALKCFYKDVLLADVDDDIFGPLYYPMHVQQVMVYWKQILDGDFHLKVILRYMADLTEMANQYLNRDKNKATRVFHICSDLTITYRSLKQRYPKYPDIDAGIIAVAIQSALVFIIIGDHYGVKMTCKGALDLCGYDNPELFEIWARSLQTTKHYSVALKKAEEALSCSKVTAERGRSLRALISQLQKQIGEETEAEDSIVDSDNEWLTDTNVPVLKQQIDQAENMRSKNPHEKKARRRPKRPEVGQKESSCSKTSYTFSQFSSWNDVGDPTQNENIDPNQWRLHAMQKKRKRRRRNTSGSGVSTASSGISNGFRHNKSKVQMHDKEDDFPGYDGSDLETDNDFDSINLEDIHSSGFYSDISSGEDSVDDLEDDQTIYEKSCQRYSEDAEVDEGIKVEENELLQNGLDLSPEFVDKFRCRRSDNFYKGHLSEKELNEAYRQYPKKFKRCTIQIESSHGAVATVIEPIDDVKEIEISGRSKCGYNIFTDDEVVVEILKPEGKDIIPRFNPNYAEKLNEVKSYGKVIGKLRRQRFDGVDHPILVCILDDFQMDLMKPLCKTVPKLHILNSHTENIFEVEVYDYDDTSGELRYKEKKLIDPAHRKGYIFLVAYIKWETNRIYPLGAVVDILKSDSDIRSGMKILRLQHQVPYMYRYSTIKSVQSMMCRMPVEPQEMLTQGQKDLTALTTFTIDPPKSKDLDDALSIEKINDKTFRVGVHIADVSSYIQKGDHVDKEAQERAVTFYPGQGHRPYHMLPEPLSQNLCSLIPGKKRLALSIFFLLDGTGKQVGSPDIQKTVIKSCKQFSYKEVQDVIMEKNENSDTNLVTNIQQLYTLAKSMRNKRLGKAMFALPVEIHQLENEDSVLETLEAHYLVEEFMVLANYTVAMCLVRTYPKCLPLRCQSAPPKEEVQKWLNSHKNIANIVLQLQGIHPLEHHKIDMKNVPPQRYTRLAMLQENVWKKLGEEIEAKNFRESWKLIGCDEIHPKQSLSYLEWIRFQETAAYKCSGMLKDVKREGRHFSLGMFPYCHFTSPIRQYTDIIVHRLLHAAIDKKQSPYTKQEVDDLCSHVNAVSKRSKAYQKQCQSLIWGHKLRKEPVMFQGFAKDITDKVVTFHIPGMRSLPKNCKELPCNLLDLGSRPIIRKETNSNNEFVNSNSEFVTLKWKKRVYSHTGYAPWTHKQNEGPNRIDPHQRTRFIHLSSWIKILNAMFDGSIEALTGVLNEEPDDQYVLKEYVPQCLGTVKDASSEVRDGNIVKQCCEFTLSITHGQVLGVQIAAEPLKGILTPVPQIFDISRSVKCCLQHVRDPVCHLSSYSTIHSKTKYSNPIDYIKTWRPLVAMEAAVSAVRGDSAVINDLPVKFEQRGGRFTLRISFCEPRNIDFSTMSMDFMIKDAEEDEEVQYVSSSDYLCIRCVVDVDGNPVQPVKSSKVLADGGKIWLAHAEVDKIKKRKKKDKVDVHFQIHENSPNPLQQLVTSENNPRCCVEVLQKSEDLRRTEAILDWLDKATPLAKAIALGRKCPKLDKDHLDLARKIEGDLNIRGLAPNNMQQHKAIQKSLVSSFSIIQGPPGTGKTYTGIKLLYLFNKINKIWNEEGNKKMQILFCGPSNKSVDLVAKWMIKKLGELTPKIVRMYGTSMEQVEYPVPGKAMSIKRTMRDSKPDPELKHISMHHLIREPGKPHAEEIKRFDELFKKNPNFSEFEQIKEYLNLISKAVQEELQHYDIIFCTTALAANPKFLKGTKGRIYQVIIDESGMCTEPESMVPIVATQAKQVVMIGDHKQLRPVVLCKDAAQLGLEKSLFERYAERAIFLNIQYRMNPRICDFPSRQFYAGKLETGPSRAWEVFQPLSIWPYPEIPHVFCNIEGVENKLPVSTEEGNENSCRNEEEVEQVVKIFKHLVDKECVDPFYINVVSQYNAQCCALRDALKKERYNNINVNTVVASQGGEWDYVIFSTVRSLPDYKIEPNPTLGWCKENLGFITDDHQVNVALTRSRKGLIIIGNRNLLKCDKVWRALLEHYDKAGCIVEAKDFPKPPKRRKKNHRYFRENSGEFYQGTTDDQLE